MQYKRYRYIIRIQYLGFRYSGWQKQPGQKTVEGMLVKTLKFILPGTTLKILGAGRTDAKVSAIDGAFELFTSSGIERIPEFIKLFNANLPADISIIDCEAVDDVFNIIKDINQKEYHYYFSYGSKNHPYCAPFLANILDDLDIELMQKAAQLFEGKHNFKSYTVKRKQNAKFERCIATCRLTLNTALTASFFPEQSYVLQVIGRGFLRYQIRMIMGALIQLGRGKSTLNEIESSLKADSDINFDYVAPGSGLTLHSTQFKE